MNFWPRERFPFIPTVATTIPFQSIPSHFNNPAWEIPQTMLASPFYAPVMNTASPWLQQSENPIQAPTTEAGVASTDKPVGSTSPWLSEVAAGQQGVSTEAMDTRHNEDKREHRERGRSRDRNRRRRSRSRSRSKSRDRRSSDRSDDRRDKGKDRRERRSSNDSGKHDKDRESDRRRDRSRSRSRSREGRTKKNEEKTEDSLKKGRDGDGKYSLEAANYKSQTPNETIMIRGLAQHITENDIRQDIAQCGLQPKDIRLIRKKETGVSRGFAFVEFTTTEEALCWMEMKQGVLMLQDMYRALMQFSIVATDAPPHGAWQPSADWDCPKCFAHNFKKRINCFKCLAIRPNAADSAQLSEISPHPTTKLMIRNLDPLTTEEELLKDVSAVSDIPIQSCQISREPTTSISRGICYLEMKNVLEAIKLFNELTAVPLRIQGKKVSVSYCKLQPDKTWIENLQQQQQQQYTLADVPQLAEYSARMYATDPSQKAAYIQYYTQYYTNQIKQVAQLDSTTDTNTAAAVAQSAIQLAQTKKAVLAGAAASAMSAAAALNPSIKPTAIGYMSSQQLIGNTTVGEPDMTTYTYDEGSGYYFDSKTGLYYDVNSQYFYHSQDQVFLYWDKDRKAYMPSASEDKTKSEEKKEDKKKSSDKEKSQDKVKVAKRIAKDMERWAKSFNQKKEIARMNQVSVQQAHLAAKSAATADIAFAVLERQEAGTTGQLDFSQPPASQEESALVASYGGGSESDEGGQEELAAEDQFHTDWVKLACLLCKRQFPAKEALQRHQQLSDLHKQNLEAWYRSRGMEPPSERASTSSSSTYRDRARERRLKFGVPDEPQPNKYKEKFMKDAPTYEEPTREGIPSGNVGSKMLQKMGWSEGMGLGKMNQGRTDIVQAVQRVSTAGLGVAGSRLGPAGTLKNTYKDNVKRVAMARFTELND